MSIYEISEVYFCMMPIIIAIFDDDKNRCNSLRILINDAEDMCCVGTFEDCSAVVKKVEECGEEVILMDIDMPKVNGIEEVHLLRSRFADVCIIMQTVFEMTIKL